MTTASLLHRPVRVLLHSSRVVTPSIWLEPSRLNTTFFPAAVSTWAIISDVEVLPLLPVTAMISGGSCTRCKMSGQIFSAICPGRLLPRPTKEPTKRMSLQTRMARNFLMETLLIVLRGNAPP